MCVCDAENNNKSNMDIENAIEKLRCHTYEYGYPVRLT